MIIKTNTKDKKGRDIYKNVLTGKTGNLSQQVFIPSQRKSIRESDGKRKLLSSTKISKTSGLNKKTGFGFRLNRFLKRIIKN
jgi:hypothetical protein